MAFDAARTAYRLGGQVTVVCLENEDKTTRDGIPADAEEIEGAIQEGIRIVYSRGVRDVVAENGKFKRIDCPKCVGVFDYKGFNPQFDCSRLSGCGGRRPAHHDRPDVGRASLQNAGLFDASGRLAVDPLTRRSALREEVFVGGDVRRIGFMVDAMAEGRRHVWKNTWTGMPSPGGYVYLTASVMEEDCDGYCLLHLIEKEGIRPNVVILGEPTDMNVYRGHRGRMEATISVKGKSAHGAHCDLGVNALYKMAPIIADVEALHRRLPSDDFLGKGSVTVSFIECTTASLNAVPDSARIYLDRRLTHGETVEKALDELRSLPHLGDAKVELLNYEAKSWRGETVAQEFELRQHVRQLGYFEPEWRHLPGVFRGRRSGWPGQLQRRDAEQEHRPARLS